MIPLVIIVQEYLLIVYYIYHINSITPIVIVICHAKWEKMRPSFFLMVQLYVTHYNHG